MAEDRKTPFLSDTNAKRSVTVETPNGVATAKQSGKWKSGDEGNRGSGAGEVNRKEWDGNRSGE